MGALQAGDQALHGLVRKGVILLGNFYVTIKRHGGYMKKVTRKLLLMTFLAVFALSATGAGPQYCQGTVGNLYVNSSGTVLAFASYRGDYVQFCNVNVDTGGVSVINCMAWFAMLKSAVQRQSQILVFYPDAPICSQLPTYGAAPVPGYVMQMN